MNESRLNSGIGKLNGCQVHCFISHMIPCNFACGGTAYDMCVRVFATQRSAKARQFQSIQVPEYQNQMRACEGADIAWLDLLDAHRGNRTLPFVFSKA
jgi:hypothetical protein